MAKDAHSEGATLDEQVEAEDVRLRLQVAGYAAAAVFALLFFAAPLLSDVAMPFWLWRLLVWGLVRLPLLTLAVIVWRRQKLPIGGGRCFRGRQARTGAVLMVAVSLLFGWVRLS